MATNTPSAEWIAKRLLTKPWLTASRPMLMRSGCRPFVIPYQRIRLMPYFESGYAGFPIRFPPEVGRPAIDTKSRFFEIELSLTQVLDRPVSGRVSFEDLIRGAETWPMSGYMERPMSSPSSAGKRHAPYG